MAYLDGPAGVPVLFLHGLPSCRLMRPDGALSAEMGARLISFDRPGFGQSDARPGRSLTDTVDDIVALIDHLGLHKVFVAAPSGGGPPALAFARRAPDRIRAVALIGAAGPMDAPGAMAGITFERRVGFWLARHAPRVLRWAISRRVQPGGDLEAFFAHYTMRSGLDFPNSEFSVEMWVGNPSDPIRTILNKPLYADPGTKFEYRDADPQLVSYALQALSGRSEESLAAEFLFGPLGITDWYWDHGGQGESMGAHGLHLRPRDLAKVGLMMAGGGVWHGTPVLSADWYNLSTTWKVDPAGHPRLGYGYYWWTVPEAAGYSTWGHGGQYALVIPGQRLVLVMMSMPDTQDDTLHGGELEQFVDLTRPLWQAGTN